MELVTRQQQADGAAARYRRQYGAQPDRILMGGQTAGQVFRALKALGTSPDPDEVDRLMGNDSWTAVTCDSCRGQVDRAVVVAEVEDASVLICEACLDQALKMSRGTA